MAPTLEPVTDPSEADLLAACSLAFKAPSPLSDTEWLRENYQVQRGPEPGAPNFDHYPIARFIFEFLNAVGLKRFVMMVSAQSTKTETAIMKLCRRIAERPVDTMWITATKDSAKEFTQKALYDSIRCCPPAMAFAPPLKSWSKGLVMFDSCRLIMRGSNSRIGLQGDPIGMLVCDERREWKPGAINLVRKRVRTFPDALEISMGVAGRENDELHRDFEHGSQTFFHWRCPKCNHSQPFRFGRDASALYPDERKCGGIIWDTNDTTCPGGKWDYEEVRKTVRYQCENEECKAEFRNHEKLELLKTLHPFHRNVKALREGLISVHWWAAYMHWASCDWANIAVEFLQATAAVKVGDLEPLIAFITETLGEPWQTHNRKKAEGDIIKRCGTYSLGEPIGTFNIEDKRWALDPDTILLLTFDRQKLCLKWVVRQWFFRGNRKGASRLVDCGESTEYLSLKNDVQIKWRIPHNTIFNQKGRANGHIYGDDGGRQTQEFRTACIANGWIPLKGEKFRYYTDREVGPNGEEKVIRRGWRPAEFDVGMGQVAQYKATIAAWEFSPWWFKEKLYCNFLMGRGPEWQIPKNIPKEYLSELTADVLMEKKRPDGSTEQYFHESDVNDFGDCEVMQLVVADIVGLTRLLPSK